MQTTLTFWQHQLNEEIVLRRLAEPSTKLTALSASALRSLRLCARSRPPPMGVRLILRAQRRRADAKKRCRVLCDHLPNRICSHSHDFSGSLEVIVGINTDRPVSHHDNFDPKSIFEDS